VRGGEEILVQNTIKHPYVLVAYRYITTLLGRGTVNRIWKQVPLCVLWGLWRERNSRLFEDVEVPVGALYRNVLHMLYLWVSVHSPGSMSFADFLLSCSFISSN